MEQASNENTSVRRLRCALSVAGIALVYFLLARVGQLLAISPGNVSLIWPASGFALGAALLRWRWVVPGVWLGTLIGNASAFFDPSTFADFFRTSGVGALIATGEVLQVFAGLFLIRRFFGEASPLGSKRGIAVLVFAAIISCLVNATIGVMALCAGSLVDWSEYAVTWTTWYLGDMIGVILMTPLMCVLFDQDVTAKQFPWRVAETFLVLVLMLLLATTIFVFLEGATQIHESLLYLIVPLVLWSAARTHPKIGTLAVVTVSVIAVWGTSQGQGPMAHGGIGEALVQLQVFMAVTMISGLLISASRIEQQRANLRAAKFADELKSSNADLKREASERAAVEHRLAAIVGTAPDAILTIDENGTILTANPSAGKFFGGQPEQLLGRDVQEFLLSLNVMDESHFGLTDTGIRHISDGNYSKVPMSRSIRARRLDGSIFPVEYNAAQSKSEAFRVIVARDVSQREELEAAVLNAAEGEKERIARDLHDGLGSLLGGVDCLAKSLEHTLRSSKNDAAEKAAEIGNAVKDSIRMTRRLSHGLNAVGAHTGALEEALRELAETTKSRSEIECRIECEKSVPVSDRVLANHVFRIAQEAVNNAVRHSGTDAIQIALSEEEGRLQLRITDKGRGMPLDGAESKEGAREGLGLRTMHYRAQAIQGELKIDSLKGHGTTVTCLAPLQRNAAEEAAAPAAPTVPKSDAASDEADEN